MQSSDVAQLRQWLGTVTYSAMRRIEEQHPVLFPNGTRLRGIEVAPGLYLARDRAFYTSNQGIAQPASLRQVLTDASFDSIQARYDAAQQAADERKQAKVPSTEDNTL